jgi:catechol 2,3-dioxygenase-like lactoylglutathione lyase family enzyme
MIKEIAFIVYPVSDVPRSRRFYEDTLGLKVGDNWEDKWVEYDVNGVAFAITSWLPDNKPGAPGGNIAFEVDDLDASVRSLKQAGVKFLKDVFATPVCRMAIVADPDGNAVIIHKRNA